MPGPTAGRVDARRNREAILRAAAELLVTAPDVSMSKVARAAGVTRVTVYRHFADRDELVDALFAEHARHVVPVLLDGLDRLPMAEAVDALSRAVVAAVGPQRHLLHALGPRLEQAAREAVADEPVLTLLLRWRETGELVSSLPDDWLARSIRAVCLVAALDPREPADVIADLAATLRRLVA